MFDELINFIQSNGIILDKPIVFLNIETTGLDVKNDRIVELSALKITPDYSTDDIFYRINPQVPIHRQASEVNGITDDDVKDAPTFANIAVVVSNFLEGCDLGGYNLNKFVLPFLIEEFNRVNIRFKYGRRRILDGLSIYHNCEPRDLSHAVEYFHGCPINDDYGTQKKNAEAIFVVLEEMKKYGFDNIDELYTCSNGNVIDLSGFFGRDSEGRIVFNNGKHRGETVLSVGSSDASYINWLLNSSNRDTATHLSLILAGKEL